MSKTNFDLFLEEQLKDPDFAERFKRAGEAWDVALQLAALREKAGFSQKHRGARSRLVPKGGRGVFPSRG
jgi:hypothetical protein